MLAWILWCMWLTSDDGQKRMRKAKAKLQSALTAVQEVALRREVREAAS